MIKVKDLYIIVGRRIMQILLGTVRGRSHTYRTLDRHKTKEREVIMAGLEKLGVLVGNAKSILRWKWKVFKFLTSTGLFKKRIKEK